MQRRSVVAAAAAMAVVAAAAAAAAIAAAEVAAARGNSESEGGVAAYDKPFPMVRDLSYSLSFAVKGSTFVLVSSE